MSPSECVGSMTAAWGICAHCSDSSAPMRTMSRPAACSPSRCSSAATSSRRGTVRRPALRYWDSRSIDCSANRGTDMARHTPDQRALAREENLHVSPRALPTLLYDGDCAFCTRCAHALERIGPDAESLAWQSADLAELGITEEQATDAVQWIQIDGTIRSGHEAIAAILL